MHSIVFQVLQHPNHSLVRWHPNGIQRWARAIQVDYRGQQSTPGPKKGPSGVVSFPNPLALSEAENLFTPHGGQLICGAIDALQLLLITPQHNISALCVL